MAQGILERIARGGIDALGKAASAYGSYHRLPEFGFSEKMRAIADPNVDAVPGIYVGPGSYNPRGTGVLGQSTGLVGQGTNDPNAFGGGFTQEQLASANMVDANGNTISGDDPYAQWGGQDAYNSLVSGFDTQKQTIFNTANDSVANYGLGLKNNILDFIDSLKLGQQRIDNKGVQADLAKKQSSRSILDMVGRGIRSGGVALANRGASDSSASGQVARAYGDMGRRQMADVGNQYGLAQNEMDQLQQQLGVQMASGQRDFETEKQQTVNNVVMSTRQQLAALDAAMAEASLPERIDIEAEKERVRQSALAQLQQFDQMLASGVAGVQPASSQQRQAEASRLAQAGTQAEDPFEFTNQIPAQFQNTGPFSSELPLFTLPRRRTT